MQPYLAVSLKKKNLVYVRSNKHVMFMCLTNE